MDMSINQHFCCLRVWCACLCLCVWGLLQGCDDVVDSNSGSPDNSGNVFRIKMADGPFDNGTDPLCGIDRVKLQGRLIYDSAQSEPILDEDIWNHCHITWCLRAMGAKDVHYFNSPHKDETFTLGAAVEIFDTKSADGLRNAEQIEVYALLLFAEDEEGGTRYQLTASAGSGKKVKEILEKLSEGVSKDQALRRDAAETENFGPLYDLGPHNKELIKNYVHEMIPTIITNANKNANKKILSCMKLPSEIISDIELIEKDLKTTVASLTENTSRPRFENDVKFAYHAQDKTGVLVATVKITGYQIYDVAIPGFRATQNIEKTKSSGHLADFIAQISIAQMMTDKMMMDKIFLDIARETSLPYELATRYDGVSLEDCSFRFEVDDTGTKLRVKVVNGKVLKDVFIQGFKHPDFTAINDSFAQLVGASLGAQPCSAPKVLALADSGPASRNSGTLALAFDSHNSYDGNAVKYSVAVYKANNLGDFIFVEDSSVKITRPKSGLNSALGFVLDLDDFGSGTLLKKKLKKHWKLLLKYTDDEGKAQKQRLVLVDRERPRKGS